MLQRFERDGVSGGQRVAYVLGSGAHAFGYLVQIGDHLFQSPLSYYTNRRLWDVAPGYEVSHHPDFSRPVTPECLLRHSGKSQPVPYTLNRYRTPAFLAESISCDRCHGPGETHQEARAGVDSQSSETAGGRAGQHLRAMSSRWRSTHPQSGKEHGGFPAGPEP